MADIKTQVQGVDPNLKARNLGEMSGMTSNIYETINIIKSRALQLNTAIKTELHGKLEEFAVTTDTIEEIQENKEQIEISKFYEKLPNPTVIATNEFLDLRLEHEYKQEREEQDY